jgi:mannose-6-phosphate isomerase-like protein (cupin superfamily)
MVPSLPLAELAASLTEYWSPRVVAEIEDSYVKVAKLLGFLTWHSHAQEDEPFFVLKGQLRLEFKQGAVELPTGSLYIVPKGMRHNPVAEQECHIMLLEKKQTLHTGEVVAAQTRALTEQLRSV